MEDHVPPTDSLAFAGYDCYDENVSKEEEQGTTLHRPMAHPVVFRYLSYSTTLAEHAVHRLRRCPAFGRAGTCLFLSVQLQVSQSINHLLTTWWDDHGPTNFGAMVKTT